MIIKVFLRVLFYFARVLISIVIIVDAVMVFGIIFGVAIRIIGGAVIICIDVNFIAVIGGVVILRIVTLI